MNNNVDKEYFKLAETVLTNGKWKNNRTGIKTLSVFGEQSKFNIDLNAFPILTTKKVWFKGITHELLWFIKGDTNIKYLVDNDVHIWDEWAYKRYNEEVTRRVLAGKLPVNLMREDNGKFFPYTQIEFIQKIKNCPPYNDGNWEQSGFAIVYGDLGEGTYGGMWRHFPYYDSNEIDPQVGYVDQLKNVIEKLKNNPDDRRIIVSAWHPYWVDHCALPPCHLLFHFNTEELTQRERFDIYEKRGGQYGWVSVPEMNEKVLNDANIPTRKLNCLLYQRSADLFLGVTYNITSYCLLTSLVSHCVNMVPGTFIHTYGDLHIYENHIDQIKLQLSREPKNLPQLSLNKDKNNLFDFNFNDIQLLHYDYHPAIKGEVAV